MVLGTSGVAATVLARFIAWKVLEEKRTRIQVAAFKDSLQGGAGAVIVDRKTGKAVPINDEKNPP